MPTLSLRGLTEQTYEGLRQLAISNHRSMHEQMRLLIEREVRYAQVGGVERARRWRSLLAGRHFPDLAADIQANRSR
ncbi:FitA-like ribbon-helix-helix domain-containing protein [Vulcanococcus limneticus]|uniref:FitA-like ribbon-helix-helix domain-containing protein n=1 Tax=Vulcanococcus limneticus TaxID=2170428 RepID=UPI00398C0B9A